MAQGTTKLFNLSERREMKLKTLKDLYRDELRDVYDAKNQIVKALPKMVKAVSSPELEKALQEHRRLAATAHDTDDSLSLEQHVGVIECDRGGRFRAAHHRTGASNTECRDGFLKGRRRIRIIPGDQLIEIDGAAVARHFARRLKGADLRR